MTSEPGVGSAFTVALPYGAPDVAADGSRAAVAPSEARAGRGGQLGAGHLPARPSPARRCTAAADVLVVDDNADMRAYLTRLLGPIWTVRTTANGEEALRAVADARPDIVLTDVMMPRVDGFELLRALRVGPGAPGTSRSSC